MKDTIMEMPDYQRPYEKCLREGEQSLSDRELLAVILRCGVQGSSSLTIETDRIQWPAWTVSYFHARTDEDPWDR